MRAIFRVFIVFVIAFFINKKDCLVSGFSDWEAGFNLENKYLVTVLFELPSEGGVYKTTYFLKILLTYFSFF